MDKLYSRPFTNETKWLMCVWDIRGEMPVETARMMRRPLSEVERTLEEAKADGYYEKVRRYLEDYDMTNARGALEGMRALMDAVRTGRTAPSKKHRVQSAVCKRTKKVCKKAV